MKPNQDLFSITTSALEKLKIVLEDFQPNLVLVHGDTTTTLCASLAAYYKNILVGHVEAGLRTGNNYSPFPEEINRKLSSAISYLHFAPTELAKENLLKEGINQHIYVTGNTVIDSLFIALDMINSNIELKEEIINSIINGGYQLNLNRKIILITGHRRENFGDGFINICEAIKIIAQDYPNVDLVYPVHLNPNVRKTVYEMLCKFPNIFLIEPMNYLPFLYLMKKSFLVMTDSGGIQEEAPSLGKPVIVMRNTTERPEAVKAGTVILTGTNKSKIIKEVSKLLDNQQYYDAMSKAHNPYGDGKASIKILNILKNTFEI